MVFNELDYVIELFSPFHNKEPSLSIHNDHNLEHHVLNITVKNHAPFLIGNQILAIPKFKKINY